jgi:quinol monooxygenase YgiN
VTAPTGRPYIPADGAERGAAYPQGATTVSITFTFELHVRDGEVDEAKRLLTTIIPGTRSFEGCEGVEVLQDQDDPSTLVLVEQWASRDDHGRYAKWRTEQGDMKPVAALLEGTVRRYLEPTGI